MTGDGLEFAVGAAGPASQRIDKWLWCARIFKTRTLATKVVTAGGIRLTRAGDTTRVEKASTMVRPGDVLSFLLGEHLKVLEVKACGLRRAPASEAHLLYTDQSPPPPLKTADDAALGRDKGAGRPTKKDGRAIARLKSAL